jgi:aryl-alcohol dehydrogenase-like predicted oxidoreductase
MTPRPLGSTGLAISPVGFGAFKIGRNQGIKYPTSYDLPDDTTVTRLLNGLLDAGIDLIDTAPAYGLSEDRIGRAIAGRREEFTLSTKVGETFENGESTYDFSTESVTASVERSLRRLQTEVLDLVFVHSDGRDIEIIEQTPVVETLLEMKSRGLIRAVGFSGKTVDGATRALEWADVLMVEYHLDDRSHEDVMAEAAGRGLGVLVKKSLAAGHLSAEKAIRFVLGNAHVDALVVGGLNLDHILANIAVAAAVHRRHAA